MYVCMYVCIHACMHVCVMHTCISIANTHTYTRTHSKNIWWSPKMPSKPCFFQPLTSIVPGALYLAFIALTSSRTCSVRSALCECQKRPTLVSEEAYASADLDLFTNLLRAICLCVNQHMPFTFEVCVSRSLCICTSIHRKHMSFTFEVCVSRFLRMCTCIHRT